MNQKHTPGAWIKLGVDKKPGRVDFIQVGRKGESHEYLTGLVPVFGDSAEANANLIAAAPELLAALKGMIEVHASLIKFHILANPDFPVSDEEKKLMALCESIVAKAEGRNQ